MSLFKRRQRVPEARRYLRLDTVLPVEFKLVGVEDGLEKSGWLQGFTRNVSKGGICLTTTDLDPKYSDLIFMKEVKLILRIDIPFVRYYADAAARVVWVKSERQEFFTQYMMGLEYQEIDPKVNNRIMRFAHIRILMPQLLMIGLIGLLLGVLLSSYLNVKLFKVDKALTGELVDIIQLSSVAKQDMNKIYKAKEALLLKLSENEIRIKNTQMLLDKEKQEEILRGLIAGRESIRKAINDLDNKEMRLTEKLLVMSDKRVDLENVPLDNIYKCIGLNQAPATGLIPSFIEDRQFEGVAFTYDEAVALLTFVYFSDYRQAVDMLNFFKSRARKIGGGFSSAYYVSDGSVANPAFNCDANIRLGIAILEYTRHTRDRAYVGLAEDITQCIVARKGKGEKISQLDFYAFLSMLYKATGKEAYKKLKDDALRDWRENFRPEKGLELKEYILPILVFGPDRLYQEYGINPDTLIKLAEDGFSAKSQLFNMEGFGMDGVVSCEWTAQMATAYKILGDYYTRLQIPAKAKIFADKGNGYLSQITKLLISDPSGGHRDNCLYYATEDYADTGHGFRTPKGKNTASLTATCYTLFAYYGYNPFRVEITNDQIPNTK